MPGRCSQAKLAEDLRKAQEEEAARQAALAEKRKCVSSCALPLHGVQAFRQMCLVWQATAGLPDNACRKQQTAQPMAS
jgi:hypothetical protein